MTGKERYLLGLDNGGTGMKVVLFDMEGRAVASAGKNLPLDTPQPGWTERDMQTLWEANCALIADVIRTSGVDAADIAGVSLSGHGKGLYLWGRDERPVRAGIVSTDTRAAAIADGFRESGVAAEAFARSCQSVLASQPVALLRWLDCNEPDALGRTQWVFGVKDYLRYRMTGEAYGEITDMSGSGLVNLRTAAYDPALFALYGLSGWLDRMPPLRYSTEPSGRVTAACAAQTGLAEGTLVAAGLFDIDACAIAMDVTDDSRVAVIAGTWAINEFVAPEPVVDGSVRMNSLFCIPGRFLVEESAPTSASNHAWYGRNFLREADDPYEAANAEAAQVGTADDSGIVFLPYLHGGDENEFARATLLGMKAGHTRAQITRAVYEGVTFCHRRQVEKLLPHLPGPPVIRMAGGAVRSPMWVQMFADVLGLPVETIATEELGALGAAMAAGVAAGVFDGLPDTVARMVRVQGLFAPNPEAKAVYDRKYKRWARVADALDPLWKDYDA